VTDVLEVQLFDRPIGVLRRRGVEDYELEYDAEWTNAEESIPLSLSLPLASRVHRGAVLANFLDNLLPDNPDVRQRWAVDAGLDSVEPFGLLAEYGAEVAGAASFHRVGEVVTAYRGEIDDAAIAERISAMRSDATAWHDDSVPASGQFSLGGAQSKFSLERSQEGWWETRGAAPSTHIFKPVVAGVVDGELIEYVIMTAAGRLGLPAAAVEIFDHGGVHSLVVERFDRRRSGDGLVRLHQEDILQALGGPRLRKFEVHGGPGVDEIAALLSRVADDDSRARYALALMFAWIVLSTDAHAKNHALHLEPGGATLTPLYDVSSALPYLGSSGDLDEPSILARADGLQLAVRYGASFRAGDVGRFEVGVIARSCGMRSTDLLGLVGVLLTDLPDVLASVASGMPSSLQTDTVSRLVEWMPLRVRQAIRALRLDDVVPSRSR
jgi:serine/threonine-protein kinase HipA